MPICAYRLLGFGAYDVDIDVRDHYISGILVNVA